MERSCWPPPIRAQLKFLKSPSVPVARGTATLVHGPAFDSTVSVALDPRTDWPLYIRSLDGQRLSPLRQITIDNVSGLSPGLRSPAG